VSAGTNAYHDFPAFKLKIKFVNLHCLCPRRRRADANHHPLKPVRAIERRRHSGGLLHKGFNGGQHGRLGRSGHKQGWRSRRHEGAVHGCLDCLRSYGRGGQVCG
jgi:hypothetical protein